MVIREEREKRIKVGSKAVDIIRVREPYTYNATSPAGNIVWVREPYTYNGHLRREREKRI